MYHIKLSSQRQYGDVAADDSDEGFSSDSDNYRDDGDIPSDGGDDDDVYEGNQTGRQEGRCAPGPVKEYSNIAQTKYNFVQIVVFSLKLYRHSG